MASGPRIVIGKKSDFQRFDDRGACVILCVELDGEMIAMMDQLNSATLECRGIKPA